MTQQTDYQHTTDGYMARLQKQTEQQIAEDQARKAADKHTPPTTSLETRLARLIATIDPETQKLGVPLEYFRTRLKGYQRGRHARAGDLGTALKKQGWRRKRDWSSSDNGFRSLWFPGNK